MSSCRRVSRAKKRRRNRDREKWLDLLIAKQRNRCALCGEPIVRLAYVQADAIRVTAAYVWWRDGEDVLVSRIATLDHLVGVMAINNRPERGDVVASCFTCNNGNGNPNLGRRKTRLQRQEEREDRHRGPFDDGELGGEA